MSTVALSKTSFYDRTMQLFGGMWFMLLALGVALKLGSSGNEPWPSLLSSFCLATFYVLLGLLTMTRSPAKAHVEGLRPTHLASTACVLIGMIMMLVTIRHLGRSFSLVPQARNVVQTGPYRWIKHPLYLAEEIVILGVVLQYLTPVTVIVLVLHIGVQVCRILYEEDLLRRNCPEYSSYEASRWRLIPYVW